MKEDIHAISVLNAFNDYPSLSSINFAGQGIFKGTTTEPERSKKLHQVIVELEKKGLIKLRKGEVPKRWEITAKGRKALNTP